MRQQVVLFGTSKLAESFIKSQGARKLDIVACIDNDKRKQGKTFNGLPIYSPYDKGIFQNKRIIITSSYHAEISVQLDLLGIANYEVASFSSDSIYHRWKPLIESLAIGLLGILFSFINTFQRRANKNQLHIFPSSSFATEFICEMDSGNNEYMLWRVGGRPTEKTDFEEHVQVKFQNVSIPEPMTFALLKSIWICTKYSKIVIHSYRKCLVTLNYALPSSTEKQWVAWGGGDLYASEPFTNFWSRQWHRSKANMRKVYYFTGLDKTVLETRYKYRGISTQVVYFNPLARVLETATLPSLCNDKAPTVMVGHAAFSHLNHKMIVETLKIEEMTEILVPLAYGDEQYKFDLIAWLESTIDASKLKVIKDYQAPREYMKILKSVDVFILSSHNQVALSTLYYFLYAGVTVYLNQSMGVLWTHLVCKCGFHCKPIEDLLAGESINLLDEKQRHENSLNGAQFFESKRIKKDWLKAIAL